MQICTSSSSAAETAPVIRLRTAPEVFRQVQLWQMPIRHPWSGRRPAASACSSSERPSSVALTPLRANAIVPPLACAGTVKTGGTNDSARAPGYAAVDGLDQRRRAADVDRLGLDIGGEARAALAREARANARAEALELAEVRRLGGRAGEVLEHHFAAVALVAQRAQHRDHRSDPAAAGDEQQPLGAMVRQDEVPRRGLEADDGADAQRAAGVDGHAAAFVRLDRQLDQRVVLRAGRRVAAAPADAVDRERDLRVLAGAKALPRGIRSQRQRDAARSGAADADDLGARLPEREHRIDDLEIAVDAVRTREQVDERRGQRAADRLSEHVYTDSGSGAVRQTSVPDFTQ